MSYLRDESRYRKLRVARVVFTDILKDPLLDLLTRASTFLLTELSKLRPDVGQDIDG